MKQKICMSEDFLSGELLRQELVSYLKTKDGITKHTIERIFYAHDIYIDNISNTPLDPLYAKN